jgi:uncharacterized delta-60 repeat protein
LGARGVVSVGRRAELATEVEKCASPLGALRILVVRRLVALFALIAVGCASLPQSASARPGALDASFSGDGKVRTNFTPYWDMAWGVALQADGRIVAAGEASDGHRAKFALARYRHDGSRDPSFGGDGRVVTNFFGYDDIAFDVVVQSDQQIVAAGVTGFGVFALARYNPDGSLDLSFGGDGKVTTDIAPGLDEGLGAALQPDGKIVVVGTAGGQIGRRFALVRYNTDGSLDTTFGRGDGIVTTDMSSSWDAADDVAIQPDGKIVVVGTAHSFAGDANFAVARYNANGSLDRSFSGDGKVQTNFIAGRHGYDYASAVALDPASGRILAAGSAGDQKTQGGGKFALVRYNSDGSRDSSFSADGKVTTNFTRRLDWIGGLAIQADGKIVAGGAANDHSAEESRFALARYNVSGALDLAFGRSGKVMTDFSSGRDFAAEVAIQADGKIVAAGRSGTKFGLARYRGSW